jgi:hypothetical protein
MELHLSASVVARGHEWGHRWRCYTVLEGWEVGARPELLKERCLQGRGRDEGIEEGRVCFFGM